MSKTTSSAGHASTVSNLLLDLVAQIPSSDEPVSDDPRKRARAIVSVAAMKAAAISGSLSLPPGPLGMATILPELIAVWRLQQAMVADIAAAFGKTSLLRKETMIFCLFKHGGAALMKDLVVRVGNRYLVRRAAARAVQDALQKIGIRVSRGVIGKGMARWLPLLGAVGVAGYAYYDTTQVAATAIEFFDADATIEI